MKLTVDRITEGIAVCECEDESFIRIRLDLLPDGTKEGSVLLEENGSYTLDTETEANRRAKLFAMQNALFDEDADTDDDAVFDPSDDDPDLYGWDE